MIGLLPSMWLLVRLPVTPCFVDRPIYRTVKIKSIGYLNMRYINVQTFRFNFLYL